MVFQGFNLFPHMTVLDNLTLAPIKVKGMEKAAAEEKARKLLETVGLADKAEKYPASLSGGQKQRELLSREHWRWIRKSCSSMNRLPHWIRKW